VGAPRVRLVVLNFNGGDLVERCVGHLEALHWPADRLDLVVVDNASTDGSAERLAAHPRVEVRRSHENLGFPGNNLALRDLDAIDFVGLINNDAFVEPGYLEPLVDALLHDEELGAVCPKIVLAPRFADVCITSVPWSVPGDPRPLGVRVNGVEVSGTARWRDAHLVDGLHAEEQGDNAVGTFRWTNGSARLGVPTEPGEDCARILLSAPAPVAATVSTAGSTRSVEVGPTPVWVEVELGADRYDVINNVGSRLVRGGYGGDRGFLERDTGQYEEPVDVFAWCGAGVLFRPAYLDDVGLFDERFFMYYEDTDLSWRGRSMGWRYRYIPAAHLRHVHAATSVEGSRMFNHFVQRNRLVMLTKNAPATYVGRALLSYGKELLAFGWRDVAARLLRGDRPSPGLVLSRLRSLGAYARLLPSTLVERRRIRARQVVDDRSLLGWFD
jgi:GT2 family glycosyltransferase